MPTQFQTRTANFRTAIADAGLELAIIADADSIAYFAGIWNYLGLEFGRPTILLIPAKSDPIMITPLMESDMCGQMTWIRDIRPWSDGVGDEWRGILRSAIAGLPDNRVGIESRTLPALIAHHLGFRATAAADVGGIIARLRMIKSADDIAIMRQAGVVAIAMVEAARGMMAEGVLEYEIALAVIEAGTRKAASLLEADSARFTSPTIYNLQILQSGTDTCMVHRRSSVRRLQRGDPVYVCFCGIANFRNYKLGFDREFFIGTVTDEQARAYEAAVAAQQAALAVVRPGVTCEFVNAASEEVYTKAGYTPAYRTGRSIGYSFLEWPELKRGETLRLEAGMTFAVDGGITVAGKFGARVGDSIVVTDGGFEYLTPYPRQLSVV